METPWGSLPVSDAHTHFFSRPFFSALAKQRGVTVEAVGELLNWQIPADDAGHLAAEWIAELDRHGVDRAVLIASIPGDQASVTTAAAQFPNRFYAYAMVDATADGAAPAIRTTLASGRLNGICLFPAMHRYSLHDDRVGPLLEAAAEHHAAVFVHCGVLSVGVRRKLGLPSQFDMRYSNPIDLHAVALRYPQIRFVIPHFGAGYFRETLMVCDLCPNVYLDTSSSNSWMRFEPHLDLRAVFKRALDVVGASRLLFGSDSSFFPRGWHAAIFETQAKALYELGVDEDGARLIFHDNLDHFFVRQQPASTD